MTITVAIDLLRQAFMTGLMLALPILIAVLVVGLVIGILQAATGVQEFTLSFVPKVLVVFALIFLLGAAGLTFMTEWTVRLLNLIPQVVR